MKYTFFVDTDTDEDGTTCTASISVDNPLSNGQHFAAFGFGNTPWEAIMDLCEQIEDVEKTELSGQLEARET